jgi:hypothetical protein
MQAMLRVRVRASKRVSIAMAAIDALRDARNIRNRDFHDKGGAGVGSISSYRASPMSGNARKQPSPREFREKGSGRRESRRGNVHSVSHFYPSIVLFLVEGKIVFASFQTHGDTGTLTKFDDEAGVSRESSRHLNLEA